MKTILIIVAFLLCITVPTNVQSETDNAKLTNNKVEKVSEAINMTSWCCQDNSHNTTNRSACEATKRYFDTQSECREYNDDYKEQNPDHYCGCN